MGFYAGFARRHFRFAAIACFAAHQRDARTDPRIIVDVNIVRDAKGTYRFNELRRMTQKMMNLDVGEAQA